MRKLREDVVKPKITKLLKTIVDLNQRQELPSKNPCECQAIRYPVDEIDLAHNPNLYSVYH